VKETALLAEVSISDLSSLIQLYYYTALHSFNGPYSAETTQVSWYQKGKTNLDFIEARDSE